MVIRVKKITSPLKTIIPGYDDYVPKPVEGQLLMCHQRGRSAVSPWSFDIDAKGQTGLGGLFEEEGLSDRETSIA